MARFFRRPERPRQLSIAEVLGEKPAEEPPAAPEPGDAAKETERAERTAQMTKGAKTRGKQAPKPPSGGGDIPF